jgi:hypothetical protein
MGNLDDVTFTNMVEMDEPPWTRSKTSSTEVYIDEIVEEDGVLEKAVGSQ